MPSRISTVLLMGLALAALPRLEARRATGEELTEVRGACAPVFGAEVCTWEQQRGGALAELGATIPLASIAGAPADAPMTWPPVPAATIPLPAAARAAGLADLTVDWEAGGHPPAAFMTPHFDFHFYAIPHAAVDAIDCTDKTKPSQLPAAFGLPDIDLPPEMVHMTGVPTLVGLCVPKMGMHAIASSEMARTDPFTGTIVAGYYRGKPIFIEPMISRALLMKKASFDLAVPRVPGFPAVQPTTFHAEYVAGEQAYRFTWSGFGS